MSKRFDKRSSSAGRIVRTNRWHAVSVSVKRNDEGEREIRINSYPADLSSSAYLTPKKALELAELLKAVARDSEP